MCDLESGYHHIDIYNEHQTFLGFVWPFCGKLRFFSFKVLPFGLSSACFCFTKLLRPLVKRWRSMSYCCSVFLRRRDLGTPREGFRVCGQFIASEGFGAGWFKLNREKSIYVRANASRSMAGLCD